MKSMYFLLIFILISTSTKSQTKDDTKQTSGDSRIALSTDLAVNSFSDLPYTMPQVVPPSPTTQAIENFYQKHLSGWVKSDGTETITIELYELQAAGFSLPINLSYVTNGVRYRQDNGDVGVGWILSPAARISRTMIGKRDEDMSRGEDIMGDLANMETLEEYQKRLAKDRYLTAFMEPSMSYRPRSNSYITDSGCDIFNFSLPTQGGTFVFPDKEMRNAAILEEHNIDIEAVLEEYPSSPTIRPEMKKLNKFIVRDDKGVTYYFGGSEDEIEYTILSETSGSISTSWALKSIVTPQNDTIQFRYIRYQDGINDRPATESIALSIQDAYVFCTVSDGDFLYPSSVTQTNSAGMYQSFSALYYTFYLSEIETRNEKMVFTREADPWTHKTRRLKGITVTNKLSGEVIKKIQLGYSDYKPHTLLTTITDNDKKYNFDYYGSGTGEYLGEGNYIPDIWGFYMRAASRNDNPVFPIEMRDFSFIRTYSSCIPQLSNVTSNVQYFNTKQDNQGANLFSLKKITYPTGGTTTYEYEPNKYSDSGITRNGAGIRLRKRLSVGNQTITRTYKYGYNENGLGEIPYILDHSCFASNNINYHEHTFSGVGIDRNYYVKSLSRMHSPRPLGDFDLQKQFVVEYSDVAVYEEEGQESYKTVYSFYIKRPYKIDTHSRSDIGITPPLDSYTNGQIGGYKIYEYQNGFTTNLRSVNYYDKNNRLLKKVEYSYRSSNLNKFITGGIKVDQRTFIHFEFEDKGYLNADPTLPQNIYGMNQFNSLYAYIPYYITFGRELVSEKKTTEYDTQNELIQQETYSYDAKNQIVETTLLNSKANEFLKTTTTYPYHYTGSVYLQMVNMNMLTFPIEIKTENSTKMVHWVKNNYAVFNSMILPSSIEYSSQGSALTPVIRFDNYDKKGNLLQMTDLKQNQITYYLWSYNYTYPVAKINTLQPLSYSQLSAAVSDAFGLSMDAFAQRSNWSETTLAVLRNRLKDYDAFVNTYTYQPSVGMLSETKANNTSLFYQYNQWGRLSETYLQQGYSKKVLEYRKYNYKTR